MMKHSILAIAILGVLLTMSIGGTVTAFAAELSPAIDRGTTVNWRIVRAPQNATNAWWTSGGLWQADEDGVMNFTVGDVHEDITGVLRLGNMMITTNDTMIARDLTLGVWGLVEFWPGLFIKIASGDIEALNDTAYDSAERVAGNPLNGTMSSYHRNLTLGDVEYRCIVFEYQQDSTGAGTPQHTALAYSISTGVLVYANTSYWFGGDFQPYEFEVEFLSIEHTSTMPSPLIGLGIAVLVSIVAIVLVIMRKRKMV